MSMGSINASQGTKVDWWKCYMMKHILLCFRNETIPCRVWHMMCRRWKGTNSISGNTCTLFAADASCLPFATTCTADALNLASDAGTFGMPWCPAASTWLIYALMTPLQLIAMWWVYLWLNGWTPYSLAASNVIIVAMCECSIETMPAGYVGVIWLCSTRFNEILRPRQNQDLFKFKIRVTESTTGHWSWPLVKWHNQKYHT